MNSLTIQLPDELYERAESLAAQQGETLGALVQSLLEEYLEEAEDIRAAREVLARIATGEETLVPWDEYEADRRDQ
ncbi:MAG TPA: DUF6290 family protein [Ardenticatenaceae bacterium]|nr:DUF6290 family protein [Ardenticatenaceae bacterium]